MATDADNTAPTTVKVAETSFGKDISISRCKSGRLFQVDMSGGGTKPQELDGQFTSFKSAEDAIRFYVDSGNGKVAGVAAPAQEGAMPPLSNRPKLSFKSKE